MAFRAQFSETVVSPPNMGAPVVPLAGVGATVYVCNSDGSDGQQAPVYANASSTTNTTSLATDINGNISFYLDPGNYNIHFDDQQSPPRLQSFVRSFTAVAVLSAAEITTLNNQISDLNSSKWNTYAKSIPAQESIGGSALQLLPTPDSIEIVGNGLRVLIGVWYRATWQETIAGAVRAAIFIETDQLVVPSNGGPVTQAAATMGATNFDKPLSSFSSGLISAGSVTESYSGDTSTAQAQAIANLSGHLVYDLGGTVYSSSTPVSEGGPCWIITPWVSGTFTVLVSVRFSVSSGNGFVKNRVMRVAAIPFSS